MSKRVEVVRTKRLVGEGIRRVARSGHVRMESVSDTITSARGRRRGGSSELPQAASLSHGLRLRRCCQLCQRCQTRRSVLGSLGISAREWTTEFGFLQQQTAHVVVHHEGEIKAASACHTMLSGEHDSHVGLKARASRCLQRDMYKCWTRIAGMALQAEAGRQALSEEEQADCLLLQKCVSRRCGRFQANPTSFGPLPPHRPRSRCAY